MRKVFMGVRLRALREQRQLTQAAMAQLLEISPSYLNQIEGNDRPLTLPVLLRLQSRLGIDPQFFSEDEEARLLAQMQDVLADMTAKVPMAELQAVVQQMPEMARTLINLHRRCRDAEERIASLAAQAGDGRLPAGFAGGPQQPHEEVRDFFYARHNYIGELDEYAEALHDRLTGTEGKKRRAQSPEAGVVAAALVPRLIDHLRTAHDVRVQFRAFNAGDGALRQFDPDARILTVTGGIEPGRQAFQLATQLAHLEAGEIIATLTGATAFSSDSARALTNIGLASYFAGALVLPYRRFLQSAEALHYDIDLLAEQFGVSFETICHRLSTLQRPDARGVPFFFIRIDRAGNISKRQSATDFHFSRTGGTCPLWSVYEAFAQPDRILARLERMPDDRTYLWIARSISHRRGGYGTPPTTFAIALGCDLRHAQRLVYAKGLNLKEPEAATPIGAGCKVCDRHDCAQRAFPALGRELLIDPNVRRREPYVIANPL